MIHCTLPQKNVFCCHCSYSQSETLVQFLGVIQQYMLIRTCVTLRKWKLLLSMQLTVYVLILAMQYMCISTIASLLNGSAVVVHNTGYPDLLTSVSYIFTSHAHKNSGVPPFYRNKRSTFLCSSDAASPVKAEIQFTIQVQSHSS